MCKAIEDLKKQNQDIGERIGADKALVEAIKNLMDSTKNTFEEACAMLRIPLADQSRYKNMI